jgi:hypothetical protein
MKFKTFKEWLKEKGVDLKEFGPADGIVGKPLITVHHGTPSPSRKPRQKK